MTPVKMMQDNCKVYLLRQYIPMQIIMRQTASPTLVTAMIATTAQCTHITNYISLYS